MPTALQTFRDHMLSVFQSAADQLAHGLGTPPATGARAGLENEVVRAAAQICAMRAQGVTALPLAAPAGIGDHAWTCARLGFELLEARLRGDAATVALKQGELKDGSCDPGWAETLVDYADYFGPDGSRGKIPYVTAAQAGPYVIEIPNDARIALIGDWGTGTPEAVALLRQVQRLRPSIVIHLGDIYYSGTRDECDRNFRQIVDTVFDRANTQLPVFNMPGNHDMYSGGEGYYALIAGLNAAPWQQKASFFCLRSANRAWQFLAMDTGLHDYDPIAMATGNDPVTFLDDAEEAWHLQRLAEFPHAQTVLLSHHQLFSAFSQIGLVGSDGTFNACNPRLLASLRRFQAAGRIAGWFWGHEHNLCIYQPYAGLDRGRCVGHAAIPVLTEEAPYAVLAKVNDPPALIPATQLATEDVSFAHGFAMIALDPAGGPARVEYYQSSGEDRPMYTETLGAA